MAKTIVALKERSLEPNLYFFYPGCLGFLAALFIFYFSYPVLELCTHFVEHAQFTLHVR